MNIYCSICGIECSGKEVMKPQKKEYPVCDGCFRRYEFITMKEITKLIKKSSL